MNRIGDSPTVAPIEPSGELRVSELHWDGQRACSERGGNSYLRKTSEPRGGHPVQHPFKVKAFTASMTFHTPQGEQSQRGHICKEVCPICDAATVCLHIHTHVYASSSVWLSAASHCTQQMTLTDAAQICPSELDDSRASTWLSSWLLAHQDWRVPNTIRS